MPVLRLALFLSLCAISTASIGRSAGEPQVVSSAIPSRPAGVYAPLQYPLSEEDEGTLRSGLPYSSMELRFRGQPNTATFKPGVEYSMTFTASGEASYHGNSEAERVGDYCGNIHVTDFAKLCLLAESLIESSTDSTPLGSVLNSSHPVIASIRLTRRGAEVDDVVIHNDVNFGDFRVWVLQTTIEGVASGMIWKGGACGKE
jgi:hypothetical protein